MNLFPDNKPLQTKLEIRAIHDTDPPWIHQMAFDHWGSNQVITRGKMLDITLLPGFIAVYGEKKSGFIIFHIQNSECEIVALISFFHGIGIGTHLIEAIRCSPKVSNCSRFWVITTNDNTHALRFYQKRGFSIKSIYPNSILESRKLKPEIPLFGNDGIPIKDEIELEFILSN